MAQRKGTYLFFSDDNKTIALVYDSETPGDIRAFIEAVAAWLKQARGNVDFIEDAIKENDKPTRREGSDDGDLH